jgi:hypothetical protein
MSYPLAKAHLVSMVEALRPLRTERGLGEAFRHDPRGGGDVAGAIRTFSLRAEALALRGPSRAQANILRHAMALTMEYGTMTDRNLLDHAVVEDFQVIAQGLATGEWDFAATGIRIVGGENAVDLFTQTLEEPRPGALRSLIRFPLEVRL